MKRRRGGGSHTGLAPLQGDYWSNLKTNIKRIRKALSNHQRLDNFKKQFLNLAGPRDILQLIRRLVQRARHAASARRVHRVVPEQRQHYAGDLIERSPHKQ